MGSELIIKNLHANIEGKAILRGVDLAVKQGEVHALMGPSGKMAKRKSIPPREFRNLLQEKMRLLKVDNSFINRSINDGFSGGEKKRAEILQMALLEPEIALMDETDSGLDIDALNIVSESVNALTGPNLGILLITHYQRMLNYITPDYVHVMFDGRIVKSGGPELAFELEDKGYEWLKR